MPGTSFIDRLTSCLIDYNFGVVICEFCENVCNKKNRSIVLKLFLPNLELNLDRDTYPFLHSVHHLRTVVTSFHYSNPYILSCSIPIKHQIKTVLTFRRLPMYWFQTYSCIPNKCFILLGCCW